MDRFLTSSFILLALAALTACEENNAFELNVPPTVDVTVGADIAFKAIGGKGTIEVAPVEGQLEAKTDQSDWCHLSVSGTTINVEVDEYNGLESRYAVVNMTAGKASGKTIVHQYGVIVKSFSWEDVTVNNDSQVLVFPYDANGTTVRVSSDEDWVSFETTPEKLTLRVDRNPGSDYREATVHWSLGTMAGDIAVGQFDPAEAGLMGTWAWHGTQATNNRDFPMSATLADDGDGTYSLTLAYSTSSILLDMCVKGLTLKKNQLMLPLGQYAGTYTMKRTGVVYDAYTLVAEGILRMQYEDGITTGAVPFILSKDESGNWKAVSDMTAYPDMNFRFEMWNQPGEEEDPHMGTSASGLVLNNMYMVKE